MLGWERAATALCFPLEAGPPIGVEILLRRQHLDRYLTSEARVSRPPDLTHSPRGQGSRGSIRPEALPPATMGREGTACCIAGSARESPPASRPRPAGAAVPLGGNLSFSPEAACQEFLTLRGGQLLRSLEQLLDPPMLLRDS